MIRATVVGDWRRKHRAEGMVERGACVQLRELAAAVPAGLAVVELGAFRGRSAGWLLLGAQDGHGAHVTSVDPWESRTDDYSCHSPRYTNSWDAFQDHLRRIGATPAEHTAVKATAVQAAEEWSGPQVGLLYHDAEHTADAVAQDLEAWLPHLSSAAVVALHDACDPRMDVAPGAERVLGGDGWDWAGRELLPWRRRPNRRGLLIVRRNGRPA